MLAPADEGLPINIDSTNSLSLINKTAPKFNVWNKKIVYDRKFKQARDSRTILVFVLLFFGLLTVVYINSDRNKSILHTLQVTET